MKKFILSLTLGVLSVVSAQAGIISGTLTTPGGIFQGAGTNVFLISTNRANIYQIQLSSTASGTFSIFDADNTNAPFLGIYYTNAPYISRASFNTNSVTSMVGQNGITNWYTNNYQWVYNVTNAANTNLLSPIAAAAFGANIPVVLTVDALCARGIVINTTTNVNYIILYNNGQ